MPITDEGARIRSSETRLKEAHDRTRECDEAESGEKARAPMKRISGAGAVRTNGFRLPVYREYRINDPLTDRRAIGQMMSDRE